MAVPPSPDAFFLYGSSPSLGTRTILSFEDGCNMNGSKRSFFGMLGTDEIVNEDLEDYFHQPEKKRRLTTDQVRSLERSFEEENKLEPERKVQLAKDLGLQPRQVAIWFQNRRARCKTKLLEKDFEALQSSYNSLTAQHEALLKETDELKAEVISLKEKLEMKERVVESSDLSTRFSQESASEGEVLEVPKSTSKQEDACSSRGDVFIPGSPPYTNGSQSPLLDPCDSSYIFEPDQSDLSQEEEDDELSKNCLVTASVSPKQEGSNQCIYEFSGLDQAFWPWS
ncbi:hypothetical protein SAY87_006421 [Trapa incisa]|uniref:Homeobox-leucine zipper protein n=1 Tax=Trapa incisa TaxID=236973 RepID=A0AAN7JZF0_9MYRT|nr:hypothetical protein SAY87_006421 [Trapa incisa]